MRSLAKKKQFDKKPNILVEIKSENARCLLSTTKYDLSRGKELQSTKIGHMKLNDRNQSIEEYHTNTFEQECSIKPGLWRYEVCSSKNVVLRESYFQNPNLPYS